MKNLVLYFDFITLFNSLFLLFATSFSFSLKNLDRHVPWRAFSIASLLLTIYHWIKLIRYTINLPPAITYLHPLFAALACISLIFFLSKTAPVRWQEKITPPLFYSLGILILLAFLSSFQSFLHALSILNNALSFSITIILHLLLFFCLIIIVMNMIVNYRENILPAYRISYFKHRLPYYMSGFAILTIILLLTIVIASQFGYSILSQVERLFVLSITFIACSLVIFYYLLLFEQERSNYQAAQLRKLQNFLRLFYQQTYTNLPEAFEDIAQTICSLFGTDQVSIWRISEDQQKLLCYEHYTRSTNNHQHEKECSLHAIVPIMPSLKEEPLESFFPPREKPDQNNWWVCPCSINTLEPFSALSVQIYCKEATPGILRIDRFGTHRVWSLEEKFFAEGVADYIAYLWELEERKQIEEKLAYEASLLNALMENHPDAIYFKDTQSRFIRVNKGFQNILDIPDPDQIIGKTDFDIQPTHLAEIFYSEEQELIFHQRKTIINRIEYNPKKNGEPRWLSASKAPFYNNKGEIIGLVGISRDITHHVLLENQLRKLNQAVEQSPISIVITNLQGDIEYVNPKFTQITGYSSEEVIGQNPRILKSGETPPEEYRAMWQTISSGKEWRGEFHNKKKNGELYWEQAWIAPIFDKDGHITHYIALKEDITEKKHLEAALVSSQKLATLGTLAAGIAHEINSPLQTILGIAESLLTRLEKGEFDAERAKKYLDTVRRNGWRVADIIRSLLTYARTPVSTFQQADLNHIIQDTLLLIEHQLRSWSNISIVSFLAANLPPITCDRDKISQIIINLLTNARDAMPSGGEIYIRTFYDAQGGWIVLEVKDTGKGMPDEVKEKIFDPFFTTKPIGEGTGLGLSVVHGIVRAHQAEINVESEVGRGTTFTIRFPEKPDISTMIPEPKGEEDSESTIHGRFDD